MGTFGSKIYSVNAIKNILLISFQTLLRCVFHWKADVTANEKIKARKCKERSRHAEPMKVLTLSLPST